MGNSRSDSQTDSQMSAALLKTIQKNMAPSIERMVQSGITAAMRDFMKHNAPGKGTATGTPVVNVVIHNTPAGGKSDKSIGALRKEMSSMMSKHKYPVDKTGTPFVRSTWEPS